MRDREKEIAKIRRMIVKKMKAVNTYNVSFSNTIDITAQILYDYESARKDFEKTGANMIVTHTNKNGSKNLVKNPFYLSIEKLRDDSIIYLRELGLTPAGLKKINNKTDPTVKKEVSKLDSALSNLTSMLE